MENVVANKEYKKKILKWGTFVRVTGAKILIFFIFVIVDAV